jgi:hypothetical protein
LFVVNQIERTEKYERSTGVGWQNYGFSCGWLGRERERVFQNLTYKTVFKALFLYFLKNKKHLFFQINLFLIILNYFNISYKK